MAFLLADRHDRTVYVSGADRGRRLLTRDPRQAKAFRDADHAEEWMLHNVGDHELGASRLVNRRHALTTKKNPARLAGLSGAISKDFSDDNSTISGPIGKD